MTALLTLLILQISIIEANRPSMATAITIGDGTMYATGLLLAAFAAIALLGLVRSNRAATMALSAGAVGYAALLHAG